MRSIFSKAVIAALIAVFFTLNLQAAILQSGDTTKMDKKMDKMKMDKKMDKMKMKKKDKMAKDTMSKM
ncbi:MAG: hypothetical protein JWP78_3782 [Mucilaginibacter sp.]|nr:hypothetical protein [Mucilaginibacter sp.]